MSEKGIDENKKLSKSIEASLKKAEGMVAGFRKTNTRILITTIVSSGASTLVAGLAAAFGWIVGTGPGSGMALVFLLAGLLGALISLGAYAFRVVRNIEDVLPDHDQED